MLSGFRCALLVQFNISPLLSDNCIRDLAAKCRGLLELVKIPGNVPIKSLIINVSRPILSLNKLGFSEVIAQWSLSLCSSRNFFFIVFEAIIFSPASVASTLMPGQLHGVTLSRCLLLRVRHLMES
jgi:hypothetical protein